MLSLIEVIHSKTFSIIFSLLLGIALASFFKHSCKGKNCIIMKAPNPNNLKNNVYKFDNKCFKFNTDVTNCDSNNNIYTA